MLIDLRELEVERKPNGDDVLRETSTLWRWHDGANGLHRQMHRSLTEENDHDDYDAVIRALEDAPQD